MTIEGEKKTVARSAQWKEKKMESTEAFSLGFFFFIIELHRQTDVWFTQDKRRYILHIQFISSLRLLQEIQASANKVGGVCGSRVTKGENSATDNDIEQTSLNARRSRCSSERD